MLDVRYLGVDPRLIPADLGPVSAFVEGNQIRGLIDERQMDQQLIGMIEKVSAEALEAVQALVTGRFGAVPHIGEVRIERTRGMLLQARLVKAEITAEGVTTVRVPEHSISPAVVAAFNGLGTHLLSTIVIPQMMVPRVA
ncbi:hypothetical protein [Nonomuraea sp. LPB2021202275-12-8]|uniref:hypothetical protein n=1 Tax=Nonomuraea sp. LPB2021202275-12-8 TaxID=3120159 RepID=UPI00300DBDC9